MRIKKKTKERIQDGMKIFIAFLILIAGGAFIWVSTFDIPDINAFANRQVQQSTKIYDRTGEIILYDLNKDVRRTKVPLEDISINLQNATIAIEDSSFYSHNGIKITSILRASWRNLKSLEFEQGGSTITQQVVKNTLLTPKKTISRKLKEWILALRLDNELEKNTILEIYLNETPYGGRVYGAEEAADRYFGKSASDLSIAEAAYLAALPQAPTYYWNNREALERRQQEVMREMYSNEFITEEEYKEAQDEEVVFLSGEELSIRAPHFVFYIRQYLEETYGPTAIERRGLKVVTTLDYELQQEAEDILSRYGEQNAVRFNATNASLVAVDPQNGHILAMVGSRDYSNEEIQGNFNAATAARQPGSSFKPFVYATALNKGYTDKTVVFDLPTQFSTRCEATNFTSDDGCFSPVNYDDKFRGPISFRDALAQSVNVPAVKVLYLAGMADSLDTAKNMGITTLDKEPNRYGLSLVLGAGEVSLLDLTSAYGVFANDGVKNPHTGVLRIEDADGEVLEEFKEAPQQVLPTETARMVTSMLSDNTARTPSFGSNSPLYFPDYDVAAKTGTTNNYHDLWTVGYNPNISIGIWSGNNNNDPVNGEVAGYVVAPMWQEIMRFALENIDEVGRFTAPQPLSEDNLKPILRGQWQGGYVSGGSLSTRSENQLSGGVHNILHWVNKNNPRGPIPSNPTSDPQYRNWESSVQRWLRGAGFSSVEGEIEYGDDVDDVDDVVVSKGFLEITSELFEEYNKNDSIRITARNNGDLNKIELHVGGEEVDVDNSQPFSVSFDISNFDFETREQGVIIIRGFSNKGEVEEVVHSFTVID